MKKTINLHECFSGNKQGYIKENTILGRGKRKRTLPRVVMKDFS